MVKKKKNEKRVKKLFEKGTYKIGIKMVTKFVMKSEIDKFLYKVKRLHSKKKYKLYLKLTKLEVGNFDNWLKFFDWQLILQIAAQTS